MGSLLLQKAGEQRFVLTSRAVGAEPVLDSTGPCLPQAPGEWRIIQQPNHSGGDCVGIVGRHQ